jgi:alpha-N-acetylglucosaminidase
MATAYDHKDAHAFAAAANQFMTAGHDLDHFLGSRSEYLLGKWVQDAESWAATPDERAYYAQDARSLITIWGGTLTDYANRQWNGLLDDYYLPRWQMLIDAAQEELKGGKPVNHQALKQAWRAHDLKFAREGGDHFAAKSQGDFYALSRALFQKYASPAIPAGPSLAQPTGQKL